MSGVAVGVSAGIDVARFVRVVGKRCASHFNSYDIEDVACDILLDAVALNKSKDIPLLAAATTSLKRPRYFSRASDSIVKTRRAIQEFAPSYEGAENSSLSDLAHEMFSSGGFDPAVIPFEIGEMITKLPHRQQAVFVLIEVYGFNQSEVSTIIGCSERTVRTDLKSATLTLRSAWLSSAAA